MSSTFWIGLFIVVLIMILLRRRQGERTTSRSTAKSSARRVKPASRPPRPASSPALDPRLQFEVMGITDEILTRRQLTALQARLEKAQSRLQEGGFKTPAARNKAQHRVQVLEAACQVADAKRYAWQFTPTLELTTPLAVLEKAGIELTDDEYEDFKKRYRKHIDDWEPVAYYQGAMQHLNRPGSGPQPPSPELHGLLLFRQIVESDADRESVVSQINTLASTNPRVAGFFDQSPDDPSPGEQWFNLPA